MPKSKQTKKKSVHLALQGGGAHGAFTWGVLDYLLEDGRLKIEAISGTSAGALNAAAMAHHYAKNRIEEARKSLYDFWSGMSTHGVYSPYNYSGTFRLQNMWSAMWPWSMPAFAYNSPYQASPYNTHFLEKLIEEKINFDGIKNDCSELSLFISASNVMTNRLRIFSNGELSEKVLLASSCLPKIHQAVEIGSEFYWDGGYLGNPSLEPLLKSNRADDVIIIQINPMQITDIPKLPFEINEREESLSFNSSLSREIRHVAEMKRLIKSQYLDSKHANVKFLHMIHSESVMEKLDAKTKYDTSWSFLTGLRDVGRETAKNWLDQHFDVIGKKDSIDLDDWDAEYKSGQC